MSRLIGRHTLIASPSALGLQKYTVHSSNLSISTLLPKLELWRSWCPEIFLSSSSLHVTKPAHSDSSSHLVLYPLPFRTQLPPQLRKQEAAQPDHARANITPLSASQRRSIRSPIAVSEQRASKNRNNMPTFLSLPAEVRNHICEYCLIVGKIPLPGARRGGTEPPQHRRHNNTVSTPSGRKAEPSGSIHWSCARQSHHPSRSRMDDLPGEHSCAAQSAMDCPIFRQVPQLFGKKTVAKKC